RAQDVFSMAGELYGDWERAPAPFDQYPVPEHPPLQSSTDTVVTQPVNVSMIMAGWHGPKAREDTKATFAADVFSFILGQKTSQFQKNMVDSGIALQASLSYYTLQHTGPITATIVSTPGNVLKAKQTFLKEVDKFTDPGYFTDQQLETAKTLLEVDAIYNQEKASEYVHTVSFWWGITGLDYYRDYFENLRAVTREDIVNYVETYIQDKPFVMAVLVNPEIQKKLQLAEGSLVR
ncbi:MAG TPA: insulinase family protein, partial [bacterium]|nr:insulinase family protein [bacterium]